MILMALAVLAANPNTYNQALATAKPGDTVRLVAGTYPTIYFKNRTYKPALTIDATAATVAGVTVQSSTGIKWNGGYIKGDPKTPAGYGFSATYSNDISITGVHISDVRAGIVYGRVTGGSITGNWLTKMTSDGIDAASAHGITISGNACSEFKPNPGAHPDCIQLWSYPGEAPVSDIKITSNSAVGTMQGISMFDYVDGKAQGGFDRVTVTGNTVLNTFGDGISLYNCRTCTVRNNNVNSLPNYINKAQLYVAGGSVDQCGNVVVMVPRQATPPCKS